jgi:phospho-2-dehydro-3-deoxyheptonate aldolase
MRVYFEKPRTTVGWKGLINDPDLDGTFQINRACAWRAQLLSDLAALGRAVGLRVPRHDHPAVSPTS